MGLIPRENLYQPKQPNKATQANRMTNIIQIEDVLKELREILSGQENPQILEDIVYLLKSHDAIEDLTETVQDLEDDIRTLENRIEELEDNEETFKASAEDLEDIIEGSEKEVEELKEIADRLRQELQDQTDHTQGLADIIEALEIIDRTSGKGE